MHIVFIDSICDPGRPGAFGLSDINWCLARELARGGDLITVVGAYREGVISPYRGVRLVAVPGAVFHRYNLLVYMVRALTLARAAQRIGTVDVYHVSDTLVAGALALLGGGRAAVWHGHMNVLYLWRHGLIGDRSMYELLRVATRLAAARIARVIAFGPSLVPWWERAGFRGERIAIAPNGIDIQDRPSPPSAWPRPEVWKRCTHRLLYVGRLSAEKGGYLPLLSAVAALNEELSVGLVLLGDGPLRSQIEREISQRGLSGSVACLGHQPADIVQQAYAQADLVVLPSQAEMLPRVMFEAWAAGVPFMASAVGAIPDYLLDNQNGFLLASLQPEHLHARLREVLPDDALRARVAGVAKQAVRSFTWEKIAPLYRDIYRDVLSEVAGDAP